MTFCSTLNFFFGFPKIPEPPPDLLCFAVPVVLGSVLVDLILHVNYTHLTHPLLEILPKNMF